MSEKERAVYRSLRYRNEGESYLDILGRYHCVFAPHLYLEIGTRWGDSLARAKGDAIAVDPEFKLRKALTGERRRTFFFQQTSDRFFAEFDLRANYPDGVDMAFLDGMHHYENLLRDFMNTERLCNQESVIFMHDCYPLNTEMGVREFVPLAERKEKIRMWTGDVWKLLPILQEHRPDLVVRSVDAFPTGLVCIWNCDAENRVLRDNYERILAKYGEIELSQETLDQHWKQFPPQDSGMLSNEAGMREFFRAG